MNSTLATPKWTASVQLDHMQMAGKVDTIAETELDGKRRPVWTLNTQIPQPGIVRLETTLTTQELQLDVDFDGQKISLIGSHTADPAKDALRASLKTQFIQLRSGNVDVSYDASSPAKTASFPLQEPTDHSSFCPDHFGWPSQAGRQSPGTLRRYPSPRRRRI